MPNQKHQQKTEQTVPVPARDSRQMRRIALAGFTGTVIEFYDLTLYAVAASLVFADVFFPALGPAAGTIASFGTLGVAFVARPVGAMIFGHFGDRLGRKRMLVTTLLLMGGATVVVGAMPTADQIGVAAPILIVLMRIVQGVAAGGELAGAALFSTESAPTARRGFWTMFTSLGGGFSIVLANATLLAVGAGLSDEQFASFGWRIPFLASGLLVVVGLYIRLKMDESPVFEAEATVASDRGGGESKIPFVEAWRHQPRHMLLVAGISIMQAAFTYLGATYFANLGTGQLGLTRNTVLGAGVAGGLCWAFGVVVGATASDRFGRRPVLLTATTGAVVWALMVFSLLESASAGAYLGERQRQQQEQRGQYGGEGGDTDHLPSGRRVRAEEGAEHCGVEHHHRARALGEHEGVVEHPDDKDHQDARGHDRPVVRRDQHARGHRHGQCRGDEQAVTDTRPQGPPGLPERGERAQQRDHAELWREQKAADDDRGRRDRRGHQIRPDRARKVPGSEESPDSGHGSLPT
ncbi:MFS transporter [Streptomyces sp. NPDC059753]|uniref:MFS transporter n=1 Tax=Streptomyces sp. NPDC059753 TaxID=3346933 RepID=UPI003645FECE